MEATEVERMPAALSPGARRRSPADDETADDETVLALVDAAPDGILMTDDDGRIQFANHQAEAMFGFERGELVGHSIEDLVPDRFRAVHLAHRTAYGATPRRRPMGTGLVLAGLRRDGSEFPVEVSLSPLHHEAALRVVAVVRDITDRVEAEAERIETEERLRHTEQHLRLVEDRERIARDLHDIVIQKLFASGMTVQGVAARSQDEESARRLNRVVDDLDDTIREIRSVIFSLQSDTWEPPGLRTEVLRIVDEQRESLGFEPHIRFGGASDALDVHVSAELLAALREGLANVARHARASSAVIEVECGDRVTLRVSDDGRGLPEVIPPGNGIRNLAERAAGLGGTCVVTRRDEGGTILEWQVPNPG